MALLESTQQENIDRSLTSAIGGHNLFQTDKHGLHLLLPKEHSEGISVSQFERLLGSQLGLGWLATSLKQDLENPLILNQVLLTQLDISDPNDLPNSAITIGLACPDAKWTLLRATEDLEFGVEAPKIVVSVPKAGKQTYSAKLSCTIVIGKDVIGKEDDTDDSYYSKISSIINIGNQSPENNQSQNSTSSAPNGAADKDVEKVKSSELTPAESNGKAEESSTEVELKPLLEHLNLGSESFDNLTIDTVTIDANLAEKQLKLDIHIGSVWHLYEFELTNLNLQLEVSGSKAQHPGVSQASLQVILTLDDIPCNLKADYEDSKWKFEGSLAQDRPLTLSKGLHSLAEQVDLEDVADSLPNEFQDLQLQGVDVVLEPNDKYFSFALTLQDDDKRWQVIPGFFEVGPAKLSLEIISGYLFGQIYGDFYIGDSQLMTIINFPAFRGEAFIVNDESLSISDILKQVHLDPTGLDNLKIDDLHLLYDSPAKHAILHLELSGKWSDEYVDFNLKNVNLDLDYWGGDGGGLTAEIIAEMIFDKPDSDDPQDGISLSFSAKHPEPDKGWQIAAKGDFGNQLKIEHIFNKYAETHTQFVDAFLNWSITDFEITYDTKTKDFVASMQAVWGDGNPSTTTAPAPPTGEASTATTTAPATGEASTATAESTVQQDSTEQTILTLKIEKKIEEKKEKKKEDQKEGSSKEETDGAGEEKVEQAGESEQKPAEDEVEAKSEETEDGKTEVEESSETDQKSQKSSISLSGKLLVRGLEFDLIFNTKAGHTSVLATFSNPGGDGVDVEKLITDLIQVDIGDFPLKSFKIKDAVLAYEKAKSSDQSSSKSKMLFLIDMDAGIDLSGLGHLPVVGSAFGSESRLGIAFTPIYATQTFSEDDISTLKPLLPSGCHPLKKTESKGFHLALDIQLGGVTIPANLISDDQERNNLAQVDQGNPNDGLGSTSQVQPNAKAAAALPPVSKIKWIDVQKHLGPLHIQRLGLGLETTKLIFKIDASLVLKVLSLRLHGLGATYDTKSHDLGFAIEGMGLDLNKGPAKISADFRNVDGDFVGEASLSMSEFALAAMGGFTLIDHKPSLFIYAFLDYPLGGPAFFFVEGIAAGFGINRHIEMPKLEEVHEFPFVQEVRKSMPAPPMNATIGKLVGGNGKASVQDSIDSEMTRLHQYIRPQVGDYFLTAGLRFSTFEILDTFALLLLSFSTSGHIELGLLGIVQLKIPPDPEPEKIAFVELEIMADLDFNRGIFSFSGNITDRSFLISKNSKIQGGFAAIFWFKDDSQSSAKAGDFVATVGGYHPKFKKPDYYPSVKRLQFSWPMYPSVEGKGTIYFALTPIAVMAGGLFEISWNGAGFLYADMKIGADFLIFWKPLHYQADIYIEIEVSAHLAGAKVSGSIGADLSIWGPKFSGRATFHFLGVIKFHITFGAGKPEPPPLSWQEFKESFLPKVEPKSKKATDGKTGGDGTKEVAKDKLLSFAVVDGLVKQINEEAKGPPSWWIVNPKHFVLNVSSVAPISEFTLESQSIVNNSNIDQGDDLTIDSDLAGFGIAPMQVKKPTSTLNILVSRENVNVPEEFSFCKTTKQFPFALWGPDKVKDLKNSDKRMIEGVGGLTIKPAKLPLPGETSSIPRSVLDYELYPNEIGSDPAIRDCTNFVANKQIQQTTAMNSGSSVADLDRVNRQRMKSALQPQDNQVKATRDHLLTYLGFDPVQSVRLTDALEEDFIIAPIVMTETENN